MKGGPYSHGAYVRKPLFGIIKQQQFGLMKVDDDGQTIAIELSGRNSKGKLLPGMLLKVSCDANGCEPN